MPPKPPSARVSRLAAEGVLRLSRSVLLARRALSGTGEEPRTTRIEAVGNRAAPRRRNILFVTSDPQRHDSLSVTGHPKNELVDDAVGRLVALLRARGLDEHTDVDPSRARLKAELLDDLRGHLLRERMPRLPVAAPT